MKNIVIILIVTIFISCIGFAADSEKLEYESLSLRHGLSQNDVMDICQDSIGFMWFATNNGLNKYDGNKFTVYRKNDRDPSSISSDAQDCLLEDSRGILWIGTHGGGLNRYNRETDTFTRYTYRKDNPASLSSNYIAAIAQDHKGKLWIGTLRGLNRMDPETGKITRFVNPQDEKSKYLVYDHVTKMATAPNGDIWIGTSQGLTRLRPDSMTFTHTVDYYVTALDVDTEGRVWIGGVQNGLHCYDPESQSYTHYLAEAGNPNSLPGNRIRVIHQDRGGLLRIGTANKGVTVLDPETGSFCHLPEFPSGAYVIEIFEDRAGLTWISVLHNGLYRLDPNKKIFSRYTTGSIFSIYEDKGGTLWLGNGIGDLIKMNRQSGETRRISCGTASMPAGCLTKIMEDLSNPDTLWIGTQVKGLLKYSQKTGTFKSFLPHPGKYYKNHIIRVIHSRDGMLWVGGRMAGFYRFDPATETYTRLHYESGATKTAGTSDVFALLEDHAGDIWLGTRNKGLYKYDRKSNRFTNYRAQPDNSNSLNDNDIYDLHQDGKGKLWIATNGGGLNSFNPATGMFNHYTTRHGLADNNVRNILEDDNGFLWLSTIRGISRFNPVTEEFKNYGLRAGLQALEFNIGAAFKNKAGEMFFGGVNGINVFHPAKIKENTHQPPIVFTRFKRFDKEESIDFNEDLKLSYKDNTFSFEFAALDYANPSKNQYKYKVEGLHSKWIYLGYQNHVTLTGLNPGNYVLRVIGSNNDGIWPQTGASIGFTIIPPFWRTWWFRSFYLLIIAALMFLAYRFRVNRLTARLQKEVILQKLYNKHKLSSREQEIIPYIMDGRSNKEIEDSLFISLATVKSHIYNIYKKMGIKSRMELITLVNKTMKGDI